jgi:outer membrane protein TolC
VKRQALITVANAIVSVVTAERAAELNRLGLRSTLELLDLTTRRQKLGSGTMLDIVRANQNVNAAKQTLVTGDESLRQAREALGLAMGFGEAWSVTSNISLNDISKTIGQICKPASPDQRTDVLVAKENLVIGERGVTNAKLAYAPTATLSSTLGVSGSIGTGAPDPIGQWSIEGVLTVPIWDGNFKYGQVKVAKSAAEEARARVDAAVRESNIESVQSVRGVQVSESTRLLQEQARDLAEENARLAKIAYAAGTETSFDLVDSNTKARQAELNLAVAEFEVVKAKIAALLANANCAY